MGKFDGKIYFAVTLLLYIGSVSCASQAELDYIGTNLGVKMHVVDNFVLSWTYYKAEIVLRNTGNEMIRGGDWAIYFCNIRVIDMPTEDQPQDTDFTRYGVNITHLSGCAHRMEPMASFQDMAPNQELVIVHQARFWAVARTDFMPNWYVVSTTGTAVPRILISTTGEDLDYVTDFTEPRQYQRFNDPDSLVDKYSPFSPLSRYVMNRIEDLGASPKRILPTPVSIVSIPERVVRFGDTGFVIVAQNQDSILEKAAQFLSGKTGFPVVRTVPDSRYIQFMVGQPIVTINGKQSTSEEAYELQTFGLGQFATITASTARGAFYGAQSLRMLWDDNRESPEVIVTDAPRYIYRGVHLDVSRNFLSKSYVMKLLDVMAVYKMNKFYFHLSDDEGWRLEIPGLPELTEVAGKRCFDLKEENCLLSQLGSGSPNTDTSGSGFFRVADYQEILRYAADLFIEVIPEFDMPGHGRAAIVSMRKRYNALMTQGNTAGALEYLLSDADDTSVYESPQFFSDNAINPCIESTFNFIRHLVTEVKKMHEGVNPLKVFDYGGDEVPPGAWVNSTLCQDFLRRSPDIKDAKDIKEYFVKRVSNITASLGLNLGGWEDGYMDRNNEPFDVSELPNNIVYGYCWDNVWEWGASNRPHKLANANYKVIMAQATHLYFDQSYEPDPEERGYYWASRFTNTRKTFGFLPDDLFANADYTRAGDPMPESKLCEPFNGVSQCIPLEKPDNIIGIQSHLWTETVRTEEQADFMIFPRFLAVVERAWHKADWEYETDEVEMLKKRDADWVQFANTLGYRELKRLDDMGIKYRVPVPGAVMYNSTVLTNSAFPGLTIEYSIDGGQTWSSLGTENLRGEVQFRTRSADGTRTSRIVIDFFSMHNTSSMTSPNSVFFLVIAFISLKIGLQE